MSFVSQCQRSIWAVPFDSARESAMYDVCAQPGDCTTNAQAKAKTVERERQPPSPRSALGAAPGLRSRRIDE